MYISYNHPLTNFQLPKQAGPHETDEQTKQILWQIALACDICKKLSMPPFRFIASTSPKNLPFNREVAKDLMFSGSNPVLHKGETHTGF